MIKLQMLLRRPGADPELDPALRTLLEANGLTITGCGRASVSATVSDQDFARLFGPAPAIKAGFAAQSAAATAAGELTVPPALLDAISLISVAPRHTTTNHHPG